MARGAQITGHHIGLRRTRRRGWPLMKLAAGLNVKQIAQQQKVLLLTVRTQVQKVMGMVGVSGQRDLVRLLTSMPSGRSIVAQAHGLPWSVSTPGRPDCHERNSLSDGKLMFATSRPCKRGCTAYVGSGSSSESCGSVNSRLIS